MLRNLLCALSALSILQTIVHAQIPKYKYSTYDSSGAIVASYGFAQDGPAIKYQTIYYPSNFPGMPKGKVAAMYIRVGNNPLGVNTASYPFFTVKIGYTSASTFPAGIGVWVTFTTGLTTVYGPATYNASGTDSIGRWVKIPLTGSWTYNAEQNFVVEFSYGPKNTGTGFDIMSSNRGAAGTNRTIGGFRDSTRVYTTSRITMADLGFDLATTGIHNPSGITSFGLFPNPSTDGRFNVSVDAGQSLHGVSVRVTNAAGQQVYSRQYPGSGSSFFREVDISAAPKGMYLVEVTANGDRITRRVVME